MNAKTIGVVSGTAILLVLGQLVTAQARSPGDGEVLHYELQALGGPAGEAALTMGAVRRIKGRRLRPIRIEARTIGVAGRVYPFTGGGTTWIDFRDLPVRIRWDSETSFVSGFSFTPSCTASITVRLSASRIAAWDSS